jgi:hypothetical protein
VPYFFGLALLVALVLITKSTAEPPAPTLKPGEKPAEKPKPTGKTLNEKLLEATLELLPNATTILKPGDAILDVVYGGRKPDLYGGPVWGYYQTFLGDNPNGSKRSGGTTCSTVLAYLMGKTGWPFDMIDRAPTDPVPGGGFTPGGSLTKIVFGAKKPSRRWYLDKPGANLRPGDAYHIDHEGKANSDHVGVILEVGDALPDGTRRVVTADGGQGHPGYEVHWNTRILSADGSTLTLNGVPARLLGAIRATPELVA